MVKTYAGMREELERINKDLPSKTVQSEQQMQDYMDAIRQEQEEMMDEDGPEGGSGEELNLSLAGAPQMTGWQEEEDEAISFKTAAQMIPTAQSAQPNEVVLVAQNGSDELIDGQMMPDDTEQIYEFM